MRLAPYACVALVFVATACQAPEKRWTERSTEATWPFVHCPSAGQTAWEILDGIAGKANQDLAAGNIQPVEHAVVYGHLHRIASLAHNDSYTEARCRHLKKAYDHAHASPADWALCIDELGQVH